MGRNLESPNPSTNRDMGTNYPIGVRNPTGLVPRNEKAPERESELAKQENFPRSI